MAGWFRGLYPLAGAGWGRACNQVGLGDCCTRKTLFLQPETRPEAPRLGRWAPPAGPNGGERSARGRRGSATGALLCGRATAGETIAERRQGALRRALP